MSRTTLADRTRQFGKEVGIIVLGVLIALALGKVADDLGWHFQVQEAKATLAAEVSESVGQGIDRMQTLHCVERRLDEIAAVVNAATETGTLPPMAATGWPPFQTYPSGVWESVLASQTGAHFPSEQLNALASIYRISALAESAGQRETELWAGLSALAGPGRKFQPQEASDARRAISQARFYNRYMAMMGARLNQMSEGLDLPLDRKLLEERRASPQASRLICQPRSRVHAPAYGDGIWDRAFDEVDDTLRQISGSPAP